MVATRTEVSSMIEAMSDAEFSQLCDFLNTTFSKSSKRKAAEERFVAEVKAAEESVAQGHFVTSAQLHEFLGV